MTRVVVVQLWTGPVVVQRLGPVERVDDLTDAQVAQALRRVDAFDDEMDAEARRERLRGWPTQADLDAISVAYLPWNDGARPNVRVMEVMPNVSGSRLGAAGSVPL